MITVENVSKVFRIPHETTKTLFHKILSFSSRGYAFEELYALKDVSLSIPEGEFTGIIGKNGSGKTTLLRIIANIYEPTSGSVRVNEEISPLMELGLGFDDSFSCRDNIYVYGALLGFTRKEMGAKVDQILDFAELERFADTRLDQLSSGMRVRLAFAIAIQSVAPIVLVDEVLAVGDMVFAEKCRNVFRDLKRQGRTIVLVSHNMAAIREFCDRVIVINDGMIFGTGDPEEMINLYGQKILAVKQTGIEG
jgi:ABC-type polysaccharide/polyol phosphate transport system ATPase subunit